MSNTIITGGSQSIGDIVAEQMDRDRKRDAPVPARPTISRWLPVYAAMPGNGQRIEWIGQHGETIEGWFRDGRWLRKDGGEDREQPALWRPMQ